MQMSFRTAPVEVLHYETLTARQAVLNANIGVIIKVESSHFGIVKYQNGILKSAFPLQIEISLC